MIARERGGVHPRELPFPGEKNPFPGNKNVIKDNHGMAAVFRTGACQKGHSLGAAEGVKKNRSNPPSTGFIAGKISDEDSFVPY
jgi:hypothetical protein